MDSDDPDYLPDIPSPHPVEDQPDHQEDEELPVKSVRGKTYKN